MVILYGMLLLIDIDKIINTIFDLQQIIKEYEDVSIHRIHVLL